MYTNQKITQDTDNSRINSSPIVVQDNSGRKYSFYAKRWYSGKLSFSRITFTPSSFNIQVEAGNGEINGISVSWSAANLIADPNTYQMISVNTSGVVSISMPLSMTLTKDLIILAFVNSGSSSVTFVEEVEKTGSYIFVQRQVYIVDHWEWEDYEYRLNTGSDPKAYYNVTTNTIYISYIKDSISYVRSIIPGSDLSLEYLQNINITANTITLKRDPENEIAFVGINSGLYSVNDLYSNIYPLGTASFSYINGVPYVHLPVIDRSYIGYIKGDVTYNFYRLIGSTYILEDSFIVPRVNGTSFNNRFKEWTGTIGTKYVGIQLDTSLFMEQYKTSSRFYGNFLLYEAYDNTYLEGDTYNTDARDNFGFLTGISSGISSQIIKTAEYEEVRVFENDSGNITGVSSGLSSQIIKTVEYEEVMVFKSDSENITGVSSGLFAMMEIINT